MPESDRPTLSPDWYYDLENLSFGDAAPDEDPSPTEAGSTDARKEG